MKEDSIGALTLTGPESTTAEDVVRLATALHARFQQEAVAPENGCGVALCSLQTMSYPQLTKGNACTEAGITDRQWGLTHLLCQGDVLLGA